MNLTQNIQLQPICRSCIVTTKTERKFDVNGKIIIEPSGAGIELLNANELRIIDNQLSISDEKDQKLKLMISSALAQKT
jgi:hypothetical protein